VFNHRAQGVDFRLKQSAIYNHQSKIASLCDLCGSIRWE
jgi:hypothetical protein